MFLLFFLLWIVLSGELSLESCAWGAGVALCLHLFCQKVLGYAPGFATLRHPMARLKYLGYLVVEILKAALVIMRLVYAKGRDMEPRLVYFDCPVRTEMGIALLANSITLTAGTIAVETEDGRFCVHALDKSLSEGMSTGGFVQRVQALEDNQWN